MHSFFTSTTDPAGIVGKSAQEEQKVARPLLDFNGDTIMEPVKQDLSQIQLEIEKNIIRTWKEWLKFFQLHYYARYQDETAEELAFRKILKEAKEAFPKEGPRVLEGIKSPFSKDSHYYYSLLSQVLKQTLKVNDQANYITALIALANLHHITAWFAQKNVELYHLIGHIQRRVRKNLDTTVSPDYFSLLKKQIVKTLNCFTPLKDKGKSIRFNYKRSLPIQEFTLEIKKYFELNKFQIVYVDIQEEKNQKKTNLRHLQNPQHVKLITSNTVIVDQKSNRILAVLNENAISLERINAFVAELKNLQKNDKTLLTTSARNKKKTLQSETMNTGASSSWGWIRYNGYPYNHPTYSAINADTMLAEVKKLNLDVTDKFKQLLPKTAETAMAETKTLFQGKFSLSDESQTPFSVATINIKNGIGNHRDLNFGNFSAMAVFSLDGKPLQGETCFPEWKVIQKEESQAGDSKESIMSQPTAAISIRVPHGGLLIADTDYVHSARNIGDSDRVSVVFYTNRCLVAPATFCDSDDDEPDLDSISQVSHNPLARLFKPGKRKYDEFEDAPQFQQDGSSLKKSKLE